MAGMAEMAQMAAILKYNRNTQCRCNDSVLNSNAFAKKDRRFAKVREENYTKNMQGRWRDMMDNFGYKTEKGLEKKLL